MPVPPKLPEPELPEPFFVIPLEVSATFVTLSKFTEVGLAFPVTIENDSLRLLVWPHLGGKVSSAIDKADGFELLFNYPSELPEKSLYGLPYSNAWNAGWDESFPAIAPGVYPRHPYEGVNIPDHGELWGLPTTAVPTKNGITTVWHGLRFGYTFSRKLYLDDAAIVAEYSLLNRAPFEFFFVLAAHLQMSMASPVELTLPAGEYRLSHGSEGADLQRPFTWPHVAEGTDLSNLSNLPEKYSWKAYSHKPIDEPGIIRYPKRNRKITLEFDSEPPPAPDAMALKAYWGVWVSTGGWQAQRHFSIEPTTGRFDDLIRSLKDHSAGFVASQGRCEWSMRMSVGAL